MLLKKALKKLEEDTVYKINVTDGTANVYEVKNPSYRLKRITQLQMKGYSEGAWLEDITFKDIHNDQKISNANYSDFKTYIEDRDFKGW